MKETSYKIIIIKEAKNISICMEIIKLTIKNVSLSKKKKNKIKNVTFIIRNESGE